MRDRFKIALVLLGIAGGVLQTASADDTTAAGMPTATTEKADDWPVPFSANLESSSQDIKPVESFLRGGVKFSDATREKLEAIEPDNSWFKIPTWLAGKWEYFEAKQTSYTDLKTGQTNRSPQKSQNEATISWGWQKDKQGEIWEFEDSPHADLSRTAASTGYYLRHQNKSTSLSPSKLTCIMRYTYFAVDNETRTVTRTFQSKDTATFTRKGDNEIRRDVSATIYDENGTPIAKSASFSLAKRVAQFRPIDKRAGKDVRPLFHQYLVDHKMANLAP
jgi:hypothetical protein